MKIFKFGGASVKDADGVRNLVNVLSVVGSDNILIVLSAMGKTTNALEKVIHCYFHDKGSLKSEIQDVHNFHTSIMMDLFENENHPVFKRVHSFFDELRLFFDNNKSPDYNYVYDQVVCYGELVSTSILSAYLNENGMKCEWTDAREIIKTDNFYRTAKVDWKETTKRVEGNIKKGKLYLVQGFIGSDLNNFTTTLGREGSDYTAAILAYILNAQSVTIWKDVPGVLSADPRYFENAQLISQISYREAIELAFYGASVIHPKTLQPLQRKEIPLYVKSFVSPQSDGTRVGKGIKIDPEVPCYIVKKNQVLIRLSSLDFSYIVENNISYIFKLLHEHKMKVDVIQNSAISFSVCVDNIYDKLDELIQKLKANFKVKLYADVSLYTIRHYDKAAIQNIEEGKTVLLKQLTQETVQIVTQ